MNQHLTIGTAPLPESYESARKALATCERIDECKAWGDKAMALASYARQSKDETLLKNAARIQLRATERCGELLAEIKPAKGGDRGNAATGGRLPIASRAAAAKAAGLSPDQAKAALRVANVPKETRDELIESDNPPTVTDLADMGKKPAPKPKLEKHKWDDAHAEFVFAIDQVAAPKWPLETFAANRIGFSIERQLAAAKAAAPVLASWIEVLENAPEIYPKDQGDERQ